MKKQPRPVIVEEAYDTGIYRDGATWYFPLNTVKDVDAFQQRTDADAAARLNLDALLTQAEDFAQKIRERYEDRSQATPELFAQWKRYAIARQQKRADAESFKPPVEYRAGLIRLSSKKDGIPDNVKRQVNYARYLLLEISVTREAVKKGDVRKAATHAFLVGTYFEKLLVCPVEAAAKRGKKVKRSAHKGGKEKAIKPGVLTVWNARAAELRSEDPSISDLKVAEIIESEFRGSEFAGKVRTIREKVRRTH